MRPDSVPDLGAIQIIYLLTYLLTLYNIVFWYSSSFVIFYTYTENFLLFSRHGNNLQYIVLKCR